MTVVVVVVVVRAYRFALDPTPSQVRALSSHCGAVRVVFNWGLERVRANLAQREAEKSYGLAGDGLTPLVSWSLPGLRRDWNAVKGQVAPWWRENSKEAYSTGLANLDRALQNWSDSKAGRRKGRRVGFPRRKSKRRSVWSCRFTTGPIRVADAGFGEIRRQLAYKTDWNGGRLLVADRWYPSSKTCSGCGAVKTKLTLSERTYTCTECGLVLDRDLNAARNLAALAARFDVAGSGSETQNGRGADRKTLLAGLVAVKRLPGTAATAGQTGTVPPQGGTSNHVLTKTH